MMHLYLDVCTCFGSVLTGQLAEIEIRLCGQRLMDFCVMVQKNLLEWLLNRSGSISSVSFTSRQVTVLLSFLFTFISNLIPSKVWSILFLWTAK